MESKIGAKHVFLTKVRCCVVNLTKQHFPLLSVWSITSLLISLAVSALLSSLWHSISDKRKGTKKEVEEIKLFIGNKWHRHVVFTLFSMFCTASLFPYGDNVVSRHKHQKKIQVTTNISCLAQSVSFQSFLSHQRLPCESCYSCPGSTQIAFTQEIAFFVKELFPSLESDVYFLLENYNFRFVFRLCRHLR